MRRWGGVVCGRVAAKGESFTVHLQSSIAYGFIAWNGLNGECVTEPAPSRAPLGLVPPL